VLVQTPLPRVLLNYGLLENRGCTAIASLRRPGVTQPGSQRGKMTHAEVNTLARDTLMLGSRLVVSSQEIPIAWRRLNI